jgi:tripartite-type tricarboxylate transporter receptor subunit TctC
VLAAAGLDGSGSDENQPRGHPPCGWGTAPDGYTLLSTSTAMPTNAATGRKLPYDLVRDLAPIGQIARTPMLLVVPADSPVKTMRELVDLARAKPNSINYGSSGVGSMPTSRWSCLPSRIAYS